jgi:hypothetical protein
MTKLTNSAAQAALTSSIKTSLNSAGVSSAANLTVAALPVPTSTNSNDKVAAFAKFSGEFSCFLWLVFFAPSLAWTVP